MPPNLSLISIPRLIVSALWLQPRRAFQSVRKAMSYGSEKSQIMLGIRRANRQQSVCTLGSLLLLLMLLQLGATVYSDFSEIEIGWDESAARETRADVSAPDWSAYNILVLSEADQSEADTSVLVPSLSRAPRGH
ncbi:hypothetical protein Tco_1413252, partial [Tanacetum coccineum]